MFWFLFYIRSALHHIVCTYGHLGRYLTIFPHTKVETRGHCIMFSYFIYQKGAFKRALLFCLFLTWESTTASATISPIGINKASQYLILKALFCFRNTDTKPNIIINTLSIQERDKTHFSFLFLYLYMKYIVHCTGKAAASQHRLDCRSNMILTTNTLNCFIPREAKFH